jgi:hypothetical protein
MRATRSRFALIAFAAIAGLAAFAAAPEKDVFEFVPEGGRTLLANAFAGRVPVEDVRAIVTSNGSPICAHARSRCPP